MLAARCQETQGILPRTDKGTVWTHPQAFNISNRLTNHGQQVHLDLSPGWCAVFVTEPGSLCPNFAAKMLGCQSLEQREGLFTRQPSEETGEEISDLPP